MPEETNVEHRFKAGNRVRFMSGGPEWKVLSSFEEDGEELLHLVSPLGQHRFGIEADVVELAR